MNIHEAHQIFETVPHTIEGYPLRVMARLRKENRVYGEVVLSPDSLMRLVNSFPPGWDWYIQMNPSSVAIGNRVSSREVATWGWFLIDVDPIDTEEGDEARTDWYRNRALDTAYTPAREAAERYLQSLEGYMGLQIKHHAGLHTGRGYQIWVPFEPIDLGREVNITTVGPNMKAASLDEIIGTIKFEPMKLREAAPRAMSYWLNRIGEQEHFGCKLDSSVSDLPRVMRMPFTINTKTGRTTVWGHRCSTRHAYTSWGSNRQNTLPWRLIKYAPTQAVLPVEVRRPAGLIEGSPWQFYMESGAISRAARIFLGEGASEGGRHKAVTATVRSLIENGCGKQQVTEAIEWGAGLCAPPLERKEWEPIVNRHWKRIGWMTQTQGEVVDGAERV